MSTQTHTVTIAQALASSSNGLAVLDTAADIAAALPNAMLMARVASFTVQAPAVLTVPQLLALASLGASLHAPSGGLQLNSAVTVTAAQLTALEGTPGFALGSAASLTLSDGTAQIVALLAAHPAYFAQVAAVSVTLDGSSIGAYPATQLSGLAAHGKPLSFVSTPGHTVLNVAAAAHDLGSNAASLNALAGHVPVSFTLTNPGATVIAADAAGLATLTGFSPAGSALTVSDTAANIAAHASVLFGHGFAQITVQSGTFAGTAAQLNDPTLHFLAGAHAQLAVSAVLGGQAAASLAALPGFSLAAGATLSVADTAASLAATASSWLGLASSATLSGSATVPATTAITLALVASTLGAGFSLGGNSLVVSDTLASLLALPTQAVSIATGLVLSAPATASVAQATAFFALPHASAGGFAIAVADTAANLLSLHGAALAAAGSEALTADATVSAASFSALRSLPGFALGGHVLTITDTAANLAGLAGSLTLAGGFVVSANAQVTAAQLATLAALPGFSLSGHTLALADTAVALLGTPQAAMALASTVALTADATVTAAQAASLATEPGFDTAGHHITIVDTAADLVSLAPGVAALASAEVMTGSATVSVATAAALVAAPGFSIAAGATLTVSDTLGALLASPAPVAAVAGALVLNGNATASAAQLAGFAALPHASLGGYTIGVVDTAANLLGLTNVVLADAASATLSANATVSAAQLVTLSALPGFALGGHTLALADTAAALLALPQAVTALAGTVALTADATVTAAQAASLATEPGFSTAGHHITIADTAVNLVSLTPGVAALASAEVMTGSATVSVATAAALVAAPGFSIAAGATLTVSDTLGALLASPAPVAAVAGALVLNGNATASAAQLAGFAALPHASLAGHVLNVVDSAAALLGLPLAAVSDAASTALSADATVSVAAFTALRILPGFSAGGHVLTIADSAVNLAGLSGSLAQAGGFSLSASAQVSAARLVELAALPGFSLAGHTLAVLDSAANLLALTPAALALAASTVLSADATLNAAQAAALAAEPGFSLGGHHLTISDTAANLVAEPAALSALASAEVLATSATVSAATATALVAEPGFTVAAGATLTVSDTLGALLALPALASGLAGALVLSGNATASAAQLASFAAQPHASLGGHTVGVVDTAVNLLGLPGAALADAASASLSADATVSVAQAAALAALPGFSAAGHAITVTDTAANLLALSGPALALATSVILSADATVSAAQAATLMAEPGFTPGAHHLTIADTAANLLALPSATQLAAGGLALSGSQAVSAAQLTQLAALGIKFSEAGFTLSCVDTAANLVALAPGAVALAGTEILSVPATVSAGVAAMLAALPHFSLAPGATLTVQDSVPNLLALGAGAPAAAVVELAPGSAVTVTAAQAHALAAIPQFVVGTASITVTDTVAALSAAATADWHNVATATHVIDTAANLAASAGTTLVQSASAVTLSGNAQVNAASAAQIASIPHFAVGSYQLNVADTAAAIASHAAAILAVATGAVVTDSGPVSAATADQLATISSAGLLSFQGGNQLIVQDSFAALTAPANTAGLALAARLGVADTAANLVAAAGHDWGALNPVYTLTQGGIISAAQATSLASLGSHFSAAGYALHVTDGAAAVAAAAPALAALAITATVNDTAANIGAHESALQAMGAEVAHVHVTDTGSVAAAVAAGISGLAGKLSGPALHVADTAGNVDAVLAALVTLGLHVTVAVTDSAADVAAVAGDLATLPGALSVMLTDSTPVTAGIAAALAPLAGALAAGTSLAVSDSGASIAGHQAGLLALGNSLGTLTLSDGITQPTAVAAALAPLDAHLAAGVMLTATGTGASVTANAAALAQLATDGHLAAVTVTATTVADATGNATALNALGAHVSVSDSAADVDAGLSGLAGISGLTSIALTDGGVPALSMSVATLAADAPVLAKIASPFTVTLSDSASHIAADLALGATSVIAAHHAQIGAVLASDGLPVVLTQAQVLAAGIDDGPGAALANFSGTLDVTGVDVAHLAQVAGLATPPAAIFVNDTGADIAADLAQGGTSVLLAHAGQVAGIAASDHAAVMLTAAQALFAGVDDSAGSAIAMLTGAGLVVTGAAVSQLGALASLYVAPASVAVSDTAADIAGDLASGSSALVAGRATLGTVTVSDGAPVTLTETQLLAVGVDDGSGSVLSKLSGAPVEATGVAASDLGEVLGLGVAPASVSISDTAAHLVSNLSTVIADIGHVAAINLTSGTLVLTAAEALEAGVDDGAASVIGRLASHQFNVSGAAVGQLAQLVALPDAPAHIAVTDSSADIAADLASGASVLAADLGAVSGITVTHGTLMLTDAQAQAIMATPGLDAVMAKLDPATIVQVSGAPVADLASLAGASWPHVNVAVTDSVSAIAADLASGNPQLYVYALSLASVTLDTGGTVNATTLMQMAGLAHFSTAGNALDVSDGAAAIAGLYQAAIALTQGVQVLDTDSNVTGQLDALQAKYAGALSITLTNGAPSITVTAGQYAADTATIDAITNAGVVSVTGSAAALAPLAAQLGSDAAVGHLVVTDSAADVIAALDTLQAAGGKLAVTLTDTSLAANLVAPLLTIANLSPSGIPVVDSGAQIAAVVETGDAGAIAYLNANGATLSGDSAVSVADAAALEGLSTFSKAGFHLNVWDTAAHLTTPGYAAALANGLVDSVHLKTTGGAASVTAATAAALFNIAGFSTTNPDGSANTLGVSDTAAHIEANLASLTANRASIGAVTVNASATITDQALSDLQGLGAMAGTGDAITVRDTAANIAGNAAAQSGLHSILASAWVLSGSGTVTEAQAVTLGNLAHFSTGGYTIGLGLTGDLTISLADANALGSIAGALDLGGHHLIVDGSAAQLAMLSPAALGLVTPGLIDSFADIIALPVSSPLLAGTVEVTGSDPLTAANVASLLALVHTGTGTGIAASGLSFDQTHYVNDTVANLRSLTAGAGWTGNAATHADFTLVARDTVANLINPANTTFLSGLAVTGLAANATVSASAATSLANLSSTIHFQHDHTITVQDTASGLLNPANAAGLGVADSVQLSAPATVDAADAESLLGISHFTLGTTLTVSDSSANLLDGTLGNAITASGFGAEITVQLAGPETLDANTAESLVSLPGFADTTNLSIADSSSYLLNSANLSAEQMAASVTLAGDETVSAHTVLRLSEVPHFTPGTSHLVLASNDFADAATLKAIADTGSAFQANGHTVTLTQDVLDLKPGEYTALQADNLVVNGHAIGVTPTSVGVTDTGNMLGVSATGVAGGTVHVYGADGTLITSNMEANAGFTVSVADAAPGHSFSVTESVGGVEGAPLVVLDAAALEGAAAAAGISFASTGAIQVDTGKALNLYEAGSVPTLTHAALVYDPVAHTISLEGPAGAPVTLVTLGGTTHPASLDLSEIVIKHHG